MKCTLKKRMFVIFVIGFCFIVSNGISIADDVDGIQQEKHSGSKSPEIASKQKYSYRYYPSCSVYYDIHRKLYYYLGDDNWKISAVLPNNLEKKLGDYVKIEMESDRPYLENEKHVKKYPPEDSEKTSKTFWSKLIFVFIYEHSSK